MTIDSKTTRIALGTDHAGFAYKEAINSFLLEKGYQTKDFGTFSEESVDYPEFIRPAAEAVAEGLCDLGIVLGGAETERQWRQTRSTESSRPLLVRRDRQASQGA